MMEKSLTRSTTMMKRSWTMMKKSLRMKVMMIQRMQAKTLEGSEKDPEDERGITHRHTQVHIIMDEDERGITRRRIPVPTMEDEGRDITIMDEDERGITIMEDEGKGMEDTAAITDMMGRS